MPIYWTIDSRQQLVVVTAEGDVTRADADDYLDAVEGGGALAYRKLYDARAGNVVMDHERDDGDRLQAQELPSIGRSARSPSCWRTTRPRSWRRRVLGILATADRPLKLFTSLTPARRWIDSLAPAQ